MDPITVDDLLDFQNQERWQMYASRGNVRLLFNCGAGLKYLVEVWTNGNPRQKHFQSPTQAVDYFNEAAKK